MLDMMSICLMAIIPMVPAQPSVSGWHVLHGRPAVTEDDVYWPLRHPVETWFWDAGVSVWRRAPDAFNAETPQQMACDEFTLMTIDDIR
jgi:hypothetical protein